MFTVIRSQLAHALTFNPSPGSVDKITYHLCSCAIFTISPLIKITQWEKKQQKQQLTTNNLLLGDAFSLYYIPIDQNHSVGETFTWKCGKDYLLSLFLYYIPIDQNHSVQKKTTKTTTHNQQLIVGRCFQFIHNRLIILMWVE